MAEGNPQEAAAQASGETTEVSLLDSILSAGKMAKDETQKDYGKQLLEEFLQESLRGHLAPSKDAEATIDARIAQIDHLLSSQLNEIMHHEDFQKLEGAWRGLHYLVHKSETGPMLKLRVLNASKKDLLKDFEKASEFDQSALFKKIYEDEYGIFGGEPFGAMIGDYEFGKHPQDLKLLEEISHVAAAAHAPFFSATDPAMFNLDGYTELGGPRDLSMIFQAQDYAKWTSFRKSEDSRFVGLTMPRVLMREPYGSSTVPVEQFNFEEDVDGKDHGKYLWGNAAYALGSRLTDAFAKHSWCVAIRGPEGGGMVQGLPTHTFKTDEGDVALKCPTEVAITERREKELADLGFIPLVHCKGTDYAAFFSTQSAQKPAKYDRPEATANARLSSQMQYIMATSRFAHYLKAIMRDKVGGFMTRKNCEDYLNRWISNYVLGSEDAGQELKARYPLSEARVDVVDVPGKPGVYRAVAFLKPHFQLDKIDISLRLVAELPPPAGG